MEDDAATSEDLEQILSSLGCRSVAVDNKEEALAKIQAGEFCLVILDLQIKQKKAAIRGHVEHGASLLREIRRRHPHHPGIPGGCHRLPILVVSGHAREAAAAVEVMRDGASDFVHKPLKSSEVSERVRRVLEGSGRSTHDGCGKIEHPPRIAAHDDPVRIDIPGRREGRRTVVLVGMREVVLQDRLLRILLQLMVAFTDGKPAHKIDLGGTASGGFKGISQLRDALRPVLASVDEAIMNDRNGNYSLAGVYVGECDVDALRRIDDRKISDLAERLTAARRRAKV